MTTQTDKNIIKIIDQAFVGMVKRKEENVIVKTFNFTVPKALTFSGPYKANFAKIVLIRSTRSTTPVNAIKIVYWKDRCKLMKFMESKAKEEAVLLLQSNEILPTPEEFLCPSGKILGMSVGCEAIESIFHGDVIA